MAASNSLVVAIENRRDWNTCLRKTREPNSKLLVLEFTASWCQPCNVMKPTVEGIASRFNNFADFRTVDVDKFQRLARNLRVEALPTFVLVKNGRVLGRVVGVKGEELSSSISQHVPSSPTPPATQGQAEPS